MGVFNFLYIYFFSQEAGHHSRKAFNKQIDVPLGGHNINMAAQPGNLLKLVFLRVF